MRADARDVHRGPGAQIPGDSPFQGVSRSGRRRPDQRTINVVAAALGAAKRELDPAGVLNPGVIA